MIRQKISLFDFTEVFCFLIVLERAIITSKILLSFHKNLSFSENKAFLPSWKSNEIESSKVISAITKSLGSFVKLMMLKFLYQRPQVQNFDYSLVVYWNINTAWNSSWHVACFLHVSLKESPNILYKLKRTQFFLVIENLSQSINQKLVPLTNYKN